MRTTVYRRTLKSEMVAIHGRTLRTKMVAFRVRTVMTKILPFMKNWPDWYLEIHKKKTLRSERTVRTDMNMDLKDCVYKYSCRKRNQGYG